MRNSFNKVKLSVIWMCWIAAITNVGSGETTETLPIDTEVTSPTIVKTMPPAQVEGERESEIRLNFRGADLDTVLDYLSSAAGFIIVREADVDARIDVWSHQPLSPEEAVELLNTVLHEKGYAAIRSDRILRIVDREEALTRDIPVYTGADPAQIPKSDRMITQVIPIKYATALQLTEDLKPLIPPYASITGNESSNAIVLTDTQSNVKRIVEIISALDTSIASISAVRVFPLEYADAGDAARLIGEIFEIDAQTSQQGDRSRFFTQMMGGKGPGSGPGGGQRGTTATGVSEARTASSRVVASADDRTNTLVISAPGELMDTIAAVIEEIDSNPVLDQSVFVYTLANSDAENLTQILNDLFSQSSSSSQTSRTTSSRGQTSSRQSQRPGSTSSRQSQSGRTSQSAMTGGEVYFVADTDTNSVIVMADEPSHELIRTIIADLDKAVPQALIKVLIAEIKHDKDLDIGVEFSGQSDNMRYTIETLFGLTENSGAIAKVLETDLEATLQALESIGRLEVLSKPSIMTSNNQEASIIVGEEVPFIRNQRVTSDGQIINTVDYEDIGIILNVTPHINADGIVVLDVAPEISTITGDTFTISADTELQIVAKRAAESRVAVPDGKTVVIGGLMRDDVSKTIRRVPILGSIPILGMLFRREITSTTKAELLIFLTPHVVQEYSEVQSLTDREIENTQLLPKTISPETYKKYMEDFK